MGDSPRGRPLDGALLCSAVTAPGWGTGRAELVALSSGCGKLGGRIRVWLWFPQRCWLLYTKELCGSSAGVNASTDSSSLSLR